VRDSRGEGHVTREDAIRAVDELWVQFMFGFSFGYVVKSLRKRKDGGRDLLELDVYEISATPSPMNNRTRLLDAKSLTASPDFDSMSDAELKEHSMAAIKGIDRRNSVSVYTIPC
jgi:hypothetical protein